MVSKRHIVQTPEARDVMEQAGEEINKRCVEEVVAHARIEKVTTHIAVCNESVIFRYRCITGIGPEQPGHVMPGRDAMVPMHREHEKARPRPCAISGGEGTVHEPPPLGGAGRPDCNRKCS
jgi:hypothetical protein